MALREIKARKAKFGFDAGTISLGNVVAIGKFIEALQIEHEGSYSAEEAGYTPCVLKIYTDNELVAKWIRDFKFN